MYHFGTGVRLLAVHLKRTQICQPIGMKDYEGKEREKGKGTTQGQFFVLEVLIEVRLI